MVKRSCLKKESTTQSRRRRRQQKVCFGDLTILEFGLILGDNPACVGAPLQQAWIPRNKTTVDVDFYELHREKRCPRKDQFKISPGDRERMLLEIGYCPDEILLACEEGYRVREKRFSSWQGKKWDRVRMAVESAKGKFKGSRHPATPREHLRVWARAG